MQQPRSKMAGCKVIFSLHDVMPETMNKVEKILDYTDDLSIGPMALLVVPGKDWQRDQIDRLRQLSASGYELAAHGWNHKAREKKSCYHQLHGAIISKDTAEHLCLREDEIVHLMENAYNWFTDNQLPPPNLYVPPAWALGPVKAARLRQLPYTHIETLSGYYDVRRHRRLRLPIIGFEADFPLRAKLLGGFNSLQLAQCKITGKALRFSLHPYDFDLLLAPQLQQFLNSPLQSLRHTEFTGN